MYKSFKFPRFFTHIGGYKGEDPDDTVPFPFVLNEYRETSSNARCGYNSKTRWTFRIVR